MPFHLSFGLVIYQLIPVDALRLPVLSSTDQASTAINWSRDRSSLTTLHTSTNLNLNFTGRCVFLYFFIEQASGINVWICGPVVQQLQITSNLYPQHGSMKTSTNDVRLSLSFFFFRTSFCTWFSLERSVIPFSPPHLFYTLFS